MFSLLLLTLFFVAFVVEMIALTRSTQAVKGSYQRYVWLTVRRICSWFIIAYFILFAIIDIVNQQYAFAAIQAVLAIWNIRTELNRKDDDDWFNGRGKKIWNGVKKAAKSARKALTPKPINIPMPSPI